MRGSRFGALALLTVCALVPTAGGAVAAPRAMVPDGTALQAALDRVTATGAVGAVAEVRQDGAVWRGSSGTSRLGGRQPAPVDGRLRAGSVTKTFTATVVLQLVGEGRLRLSDTAERWLPGLVPGPRSPAAPSWATAAALPATARSPSTHSTAPARSPWTGPTGAPTPTPTPALRPWP